MTRQEEMPKKLSEKISECSLLEPVIIFDADGLEFDMDKWLSYCKSGQLEIVSSKYYSPQEIIKEYEDADSDKQISDADN